MKYVLAVFALLALAGAESKVATVEYVSPSVISIRCAAGDPTVAASNEEQLIVVCRPR